MIRVSIGKCKILCMESGLLRPRQDRSLGIVSSISASSTNVIEISDKVGAPPIEGFKERADTLTVGTIPANRAVHQVKRYIDKKILARRTYKKRQFVAFNYATLQSLFG